MTPATQRIYDIVSRIHPMDDIETAHQADVLAWVQSGAPLFRTAKPDVPPKHLVAYFVPYDENAGKIMLIDHVISKLWLPPGGHVEVDEDPRTTVAREADEELKMAADFATKYGADPLFVTVTMTKEAGPHTDISLWYIIRGDSDQPLTYDVEEINNYIWLAPKDVLAMHIEKLDPNMHRFVQKMQAVVGEAED